MDNRLSLTIAQFTNSTNQPSRQPTVTHNGLPFGVDVSLSPAVAISGDVLGFGEFNGLTLAWYGYNATAKTWSTGTAWLAAVTTTSTYTASIPMACDLFAAVVMRTTYWNETISGTAPAGSTITTGSLPSPEDDPGSVLLSLTFAPGQGRSVYVYAGLPVNYLPYGQATIPPGEIYPQTSFPPASVVGQADSNESYTVGGTTVSPTSASFIQGLFTASFAPWVTPVQMKPDTANPASLRAVTVQGVSTNSQPGGWVCFIIYQSHAGDLYLLVGAAGPNQSLITQGIELYSAASDPLQQVQIELTAVVNIFSDNFFFNIASVSEQVNPDLLSKFLQTILQSAKSMISLLFSLAMM